MVKKFLDPNIKFKNETVEDGIQLYKFLNKEYH